MLPTWLYCKEESKNLPLFFFFFLFIVQCSELSGLILHLVSGQHVSMGHLILLLDFIAPFQSAGQLFKLSADETATK